MKTVLKYLTIVALAIVALTWLSVKVTSTEDGGEVHEDPAAREAFRRLQLQDENGNIPPNGLKDAYEHKKTMEFLPEAWSAFLENSETEIKEDVQTGVVEGVQAGAPDRPIPWVSIGPGNIGGRIRSISFTRQPAQGPSGLAECLAAFGKQPMAALPGARTRIPCPTWR